MPDTLRHIRRRRPPSARRATFLVIATILVATTAFSCAATLAAAASPALTQTSAVQSALQDLQGSAARFVNREVAQATALYFACFGIYTLLAFLFLIYWRWIRRDFRMLSVGLLSLVMAVHTAAVSGTLAYVLPSFVDVQTSMILEAACYLLLNGFIAFMLWAFFPQSFRPPATDWIGYVNTVVAAGAIVAAALFAFVVVLSGDADPYMLAASRWITVLLMIVVSALAIQGLESKQLYGKITAVGLALLVVGSIHDVLFADLGPNGRPYMITFAILGFLLLRTYVVLRRSAESTQMARLSSRRLRREVEARTKELRAASVAAQAANMAKTEFVTAVTHELRTPLASLLGYVDLIRDEMGGELTPDRREFFVQIELSADRLMNLVNNLLDLAKIESGRIEVAVDDVNVAEVAQGVCNELYPIAKEKELYLETDVRTANTCLRTDEQWLSVVLANLVSNAVKYTEEGGVTIRIEDGVMDGEPASSIKVIDTGPGISSDFIPRLFHRFSREQRARDDAPTGSGLGLTIVRELLEHLGGTIDVDSEPGQGSVFTVLLPSSGPSVTREA